jgi:endo-alpha-1,4-polygalactosaminidase (GH114 family)
MRLHLVLSTSLAASFLLGCAANSAGSSNSNPAESRRAGTLPTWSIQYEGTIVPRGKDYHIVDLFDVSDADLAQLKAQGTRPIAYFSSQFENWRADARQFPTEALRGSLDGWKGERWVDTHSQGVRQIMLARMDLARQRGFYGVDCDNVDFYEFRESKGTARDALEYVRFLADAAHARGLRFGLKNATGLIHSTADVIDYYVNEEAHQYHDTDAYAGIRKPIFNIEYEPLQRGTAGMYTIYKSGAVMDGREVVIPQ